MAVSLSDAHFHKWGGGLFVMPHGLTVDKYNDIWVTDVGLKQVLNMKTAVFENKKKECKFVIWK